ncbi:MAG TPA: ADOP family duplicated permease [Candidatus Acidoferrum sp.]|jgi:predicted permease|nr:ADOP family duplicated permease [Candidatus Acidoferrum sp.]
MPEWSREVREALAGATLTADAAREEAVVEELAQDLAERYEWLVREGVEEAEALRRLRGELREPGFLAGLRPRLEPRREAVTPGVEKRERLFTGVQRDVRLGVRLLRANPAFALVAILSLTLGIGANTAIFELLNAVLLRTLPVAAPQQLAEVQLIHPGRIGSSVARQQIFSSAQWGEIEKQQQGFSGIAAWSTERFNLGSGGEARYAKGLWVSGDFFHVLQVNPKLGRLFAKSDDYKGCGVQGVVLSDAFWQQEFGGRVDVLGRMLPLDGLPFQIIGVTPASFSGLEVGFTFDVALPLCSEPALLNVHGKAIGQGEQPWTNDATTWWLAAIGRLKPGWTVERATAQLNAVAPGILAETLPASYDAAAREKYLKFSFRVLPAATGVSELKANFVAPLFVLLGISGLVLLIACANLANLMLARASAREPEMALRVTLGASRGRLLRQMLVESLLLAVIGAASGTALAQVLGRGLVSFIGDEGDPLFLPLSLDWRVLVFTMGLAVFTCLLFGVAPALQAARCDPGAAMKGGRRGVTSGRQGLMLRRGLIVSQVALSLVLLVAALLFVSTFRNLVLVNAGLQQNGVLVADFDFSPLKIPVAARPQYKRDLLTNVRTIPGVEFAAEAVNVPMSGNGWNRFINIPELGISRKLVNFNAVSDRFFQTLQIPLLAGRDFRPSDTGGSPPAAIVNEKFAREVLGGAYPIGRAFTLRQPGGQPDKIYQIVGLVGDTKYRDVHEEFQPIIFLAENQDAEPDPESTLLIRTDKNVSSLIVSVKEMAQRTNPEMVLSFSVLRTSVLRGLSRERLMATLSGFYGALAAVLAMVGLYGIVSYMVIRRRKEIGIRMAMGADKASILRMILKEAMGLLGAGLAIGIVLVLGAGGVAETMLYGIKANDAVSLGLAVGALAVAAACASLIPAARATGVQPVEVLREE